MAQAMVDQRIKEEGKNGTAFAEELSRQLKEHAMVVEGDPNVPPEKPAPKKRGPPKKKDPELGPKESTKKLLEKFPSEEEPAPKKQGTKRKAPAKVNAQADPDEPPKKKAKLNNSGARKKQPLTAEERLGALEEEVKRLYAILAEYDYDDHEKRIYELEVSKAPKKAKRQNATVGASVAELVNKDLFG